MSGLTIRSVRATYLLSLDTSTTPSRVDIGIDEWSALQLGERDENGNRESRLIFRTMKGIFEIETHPTDEAKDKLKWCFAMPSKPRPTDFSVEPGSDHKLVELQRNVTK